MRKVLSRLTPRHWSWLHFKLALLVWSLTFLRYTPIRVDDTLGAQIVQLALGVTALGCLISMVGLIMSAQGGKAGVIGLSIELSGIYFTFAAPIVYFFTQVWLAASLPEGEQRYALGVYAYVVIAAMICRLVIVRPRRKREANDPSKEA